MKTAKSIIWLRVLALCSIIAGIVLLFESQPMMHHSQHRGIFSFMDYSWVLFIVGGLFLLSRVRVCFIGYIVIGAVYILYNVGIFLLMMFFGFVMNDSNIPIGAVVTMLTSLGVMVLLPCFYWLVSIFYVTKMVNSGELIMVD